MTQIRLPYVHEYIDVRGKPRRQFRRKGSRKVNLPGIPGSATFMAAYQAALDGVTSKIVVASDRAKPGTISALVISYYGSSEFKGLSASTQATYRGIIDRFRNTYGEHPVARLERRHVKAIVDKKADTPAAANNLLRMIRMLMQFAIASEVRRDDPTVTIKTLRSKTDGFYTWSEEDISTFEDRYAIGTRARLALALLLYTGQRRSDVVRMGRQHVRNGALTVRQQKTGTSLEIPLHPELRAVLDASQAEHLTFLVTHEGRPFAPAGFTNWFRDMVRAAGLPNGCSPHGLRKAACRRLAEAGCTPHEIMSISGHKSLKEVTRYTAAAEQKRLAVRAMSTVIGMEREQPLANTAKMLATSTRNPLT